MLFQLALLSCADHKEQSWSDYFWSFTPWSEEPTADAHRGAHWNVKDHLPNSDAIEKFDTKMRKKFGKQYVVAIVCLTAAVLLGVLFAALKKYRKRRRSRRY